MNSNIDLLGRKIKALRHYLGLKQKDFAESLGKSSETVLNWEKGKTVPRDKSIELICQVYDVHPSWFAESDLTPPKISLRKEEKDAVEVEVLTLAGLGDLYDLQNHKPIEIAQLAKDLVINVGRKTRTAVRCEGDSMYPTILAGALVGIDFNNREPIDNGVFLLYFRDLGLTIKRLRFKTDGYLIVADNPTIEDEFIPKDRLEEGLVVGRVRWIHNEV